MGIARSPGSLAGSGDVWLRNDRQTNQELTPLTRSVALDLDVPSVHLDQILHQAQADTEPALRSGHRSLDLREHLEDRTQMGGGNADAGILHRHHHVAPLPLRRQVDATAVLAELGGVVEQVQKHLRQPGLIGVDEDRLCRQSHRQFVALFFDERTARFDCLGNDLRQFDAFAPAVRSCRG